MQNKQDLISKLDQIVDDVEYDFSEQHRLQLLEIRDCLAKAATEKDYITGVTELLTFIFLVKDLYDLIQCILESQ